jgi:hypothetical protein
MVQASHSSGARRPGEEAGHSAVQQIAIPAQTHTEFVENPGNKLTRGSGDRAG